MLEIEIVYGLPDRQVLKTMQLAEEQPSAPPHCKAVWTAYLKI